MGADAPRREEPADRPPVLLDTNVFVAAAFNPSSGSARIVAGVRKGTWALVWNQATRGETRAVLRRIPRIRWEDYEDLFREEGEHAEETQPSAYRAVPDPDDREFAALAAAAGAVLVTNDRHLLGVRGGLDITVCTPSEYLADSGT